MDWKDWINAAIGAACPRNFIRFLGFDVREER